MGSHDNNQLPTVMVVGPFSGTGGVVTFQRNLMERSPLRKEWRFVPYNNSRPPKRNTVENLSYRALFNAGPKRVVIGALVTLKNLLLFPLALLRHRPQVVQIQSSDYFAFWESSAYQRIASFMGMPTVVRFGGSFNFFYEAASPRGKSAIRKVLDRPDGVIVQSKMWHAYFTPLVSNPARLHIIPNAVPEPPPFHTHPIPQNKPRALLICGENARLKGVYTVLDALVLLDHKVTIDLVSVSPSLIAEIENHACRQDITVHPTLSHSALLALYSVVDIFLIPSEREGFPNALLEAMAAGLPVVGSPAGAIPEVLIHGQGGFLHPHDDSQSLASSLLQLVGSHSLREQMGRYNHMTVCRSFTLQTAFSPFSAVWRKAMTD